MKKKFAALLMVLMSAFLSACTSNRVYSFPGDFVLFPSEVPEGFELVELTEQMERLGYDGNPGYLNYPLAFDTLYSNVDSLKIANMYASLYEKPEEPDTDLGVFVVQYLSTADFRDELSKVVPVDGRVYLKGNKYLVMIWSDGGQYLEASNEIADHMIERLELERVE